MPSKPRMTIFCQYWLAAPCASRTRIAAAAASADEDGGHRHDAQLHGNVAPPAV